jgi:hypothetical protein
VQGPHSLLEENQPWAQAPDHTCQPLHILNGVERTFSDLIEGNSS